MFVAALGAAIAFAALRGTADAGGDKRGAAESPARPAPDSATIAAGEKLFIKNCTPCHGASGHGDGPASVALNPKPRNFTQPSQFKSKTDDEVFQVISKGGAARKLSPAMPPWGPTLKREQIWQLIAFIRTFPARDSIARAHAAK